MFHIMTFNGDLKDYPPIISLIEYLLLNKINVIFIGDCSDNSIVSTLTSQGLIYEEIKLITKNHFYKFILYCLYRYKVTFFLKKFRPGDIKFWIFDFTSLGLLGRLIGKYKTIAYLFEFTPIKFPLIHRLIGWNSNVTKVLQSAYQVVCCENNRAILTQGLFGLKEKPIVIPNKTMLPEAGNLSFGSLSDKVVKLLQTKKVIIYQGGIGSPERRLDELCESISLLPNEFAIIILGDGKEYKALLRKKYESDRIIFIDFIPFPDYLNITCHSYIGFLTYHPQPGNITQVINTTFCAPNKIFEYTKYGLPVISNELLSFEVDLKEFGFGISHEVFSAKKIAASILRIDRNYDSYRNGSFAFYESKNINNKIDLLLGE